jgi:hypothetical protein
VVSAARNRVRLLVSALAFTLAASGLTVGLAGPAAALPDAPTNLASTGGPIPTLTWDRVDGALRYTIQGSESSSFTSTIFNLDTTNTTYIPTRVLKSGVDALYWRVRSIDNSGQSAWVETSTDIDPTPAPLNVKVSPGETILPPVSPPVITWDPVAGAIGYDVEMDNEGDGVGGTLKQDVKTTTYVWPDPQGVGENAGTEDFHVRVRAKFANNLQTEWSPYTAYNVTQLNPVTSADCAAGLLCAPATPGVPRPSITVQDVIFDWDPVPGAKQYEIWVALDASFTNEVEKKTVWGTRYSPATTYGNNNYFWKVRAVNAAGQPTPWPSEPSVFQRRWPDQPTLLYPPNTLAPTVGDDLYFQWTPVKHATRYQLDVGTDPNFTPFTYQTCITVQTTYTPGSRSSDQCTPDQGQAYYWRVKALDLPKNVEGIYSDTDPVAPGNQAGRFTYDSGPVQLTAPANGATVEVPTLRWNPQRDAQKYKVIIQAGGVTVDTIDTSALSYTPSERLDPEDGPYYWTVQAIDGDNRVSPRYTGRTFQTTEAITEGQDPLTPLPADVEPVSWRFPRLAWQPMDGVDYYRLRVSETPGFVLSPSATPVLNRELSYPSVTDDSTYFLRPGSYTWWVEAHAEGGALLGVGSESTFTIAEPAAVTGQRIALDGMALDAGTACGAALANAGATCDNVPSTPVLDWEPVAGMGGYLVYLAEDPDFTNRTLQPYAVSITSRWTPTFYDLNALPDNESGEAYYWFIRPCVSVTPIRNCGPDPISQTDAATNAFRKVSPAVVLQSPAADSVEDDTEVTFSWEDYRTTNANAPLFYGGAAPSHQSAMSYRIQVAANATITDANAIDDVVVDQPTYTAFTKTYPEGDLWWRVQAIDAKSNRLNWSPTRKFVKRTPANILDPAPNELGGPVETVDPGTYPAYDQHIQSGEFPFRWQAKPFDVNWKIEIYKNDDTTLSVANRVLSLTSKQAAFVPPAVLEASSQAYRWRVVRYDVSNQDNKGRWSDLGRFFVDERPVNVVSPVAGAEQEPNGPVFTWQTYPTGTGQAAKYSLEVKNSANTVVESLSSTPATSWASVRNYTTGTYSWTVTAYDTNGKQLGKSLPETFTVDTALHALTKPVIEAPDGPEVGRTVTSTAPTWDQSGVAMSYQWLRNGAAISGATQTSYTTVAADVDKELTLRVTGKRPGYTDGVTVSDPLDITAAPAPTPTVPPSITGVAAARETLTANNGTWPDGGFTYTYQWFVNGLAVARETRNTYVVRTRDAGLPVKVRVTASKVGYLPGSAYSGEVKVAKLKTTTTATLESATISKRARGVINAHVDVLDLGVPLGKIQIKDGTKVIGTVNLKNDSGGNVKIRLKKLLPGKHKLTVVYLGSTATTSSKSKKLKLVVLKK